MKAADIRNLSAEELNAKEKELRAELGNLSFKHGVRRLEDTSRLKTIRKDIARIQTIRNEAKA